MLRKLVLALVLANAGVWLAYQSGLLGAAQHEVREPERLQRQMHPHWVHLGPWRDPVPAPQAAPAPTPPPPPEVPPEAPPEPAPEEETASTAATAPEPAAESPAPETLAHTEPAAMLCRQAGPFTPEQAKALRAALARWSAGRWGLDTAVTPARWMVWLSLPDADSVNPRRAELRARDVDVDLPAAAFRPGLSLGRFSTQDSARQQMSDLILRGVQGLQVVAERPEGVTHTLRLSGPEPAVRQQTQALVQRGLVSDGAWQACAN